MLISLFFLQSLGGAKLLEKGLEDAAKSDSQLINGLLSGAVVFLLFILFCVVKVLRKDKETAVHAAYESAAKEQAINEGAHQAMTASKDLHIQHLSSENINLKADFLMITKDNTEAFKQVAIKIGSFVEGQAVVAANQERNKSDTLLEINRLFSQFFKHN